MYETQVPGVDSQNDTRDFKYSQTRKGARAEIS